jgi:integrase
MQQKTQAEYRSLAAHFYATRLRGQPHSPKRIADALAACSSEYRPAYFRRLRSAIAYDQQAKGHGEAADRIRSVQNLAQKRGLKLPPKQKRVTSVAEKDEEKLLNYLGPSQDAETTAAVLMAKYLGVRPSEMMGIRIEGEKVVIQGAKKSHEGSRGADRVVEVAPLVLGILTQCVEALRSSHRGMTGVQDRLRRICKHLWPQRKALPTLYSYRHQIGSDLRAQGIDRVTIAYLMGHQATKSVEQYGDKRSGRGKPLIRPAADADLSRIRQNHVATKGLKALLEPAAPSYDFGFDDGPGRR